MSIKITYFYILFPHLVQNFVYESKQRNKVNVVIKFAPMQLIFLIKYIHISMSKLLKNFYRFHMLYYFIL